MNNPRKYWNGVVILCHAIGTILHFSMPTMIFYSFFQLFGTWVPLLRNPQICGILVTDQNNTSVIIGTGPISARILSWGTDTFLFIMLEIIETKGLSQSFQLLALSRLGPQVSTPYKILLRHLDVFVVPSESQKSAQYHQHIVISV